MTFRGLFCRSTLLLSAFALGSCDLCSPISGHDCVGNDLFNRSAVTTPAACCALCTGACTVWKWNTDNNCFLKDGCDNVVPCPSCVTGSIVSATPTRTATQTPTVSPSPSFSPEPVSFRCAARDSVLTVYADASYSLSTGAADGGSSWFTGGDLAFRASSSWYGVAAGGLRALATARSNGTDAFGGFVAYSVTLKTVGEGAPGLTVVATFACYESGLVAFNASVPSGANDTATGSGSTPVLQFPSFSAAPGTVLGSTLGWLANGGIWTLFELWGVGAANGLPATDGPVWLYNTTFAPSTTAPASSPPAPVAAILAPLAHFKASQAAVIPDPTTPDGLQRLVIGPLGSALSIPPGYSTSSGMWVSSEGVNAATFEWGAALRAAYGTQRIPRTRDVLNEKLSYWSDNGAVYFQSWWDAHCDRHCNSTYNAATQFAALKAYHESVGLPFALYQLDTWWFLQGSDVGFSGSLDCADWQPRADLFPDGLPSVTAQNIPLLLYSWGYIPVSKGNRMTNFTWIPNGGADTEAMVALDEMYAFYSMIRDRFLAYNGTSFEQDNMGSYSSGWAQVTSAIDGAERWWAGFASPWCESNIPVQICESTASDILESVRYGCVTSSRDNIDDVPGTHQSNQGNDPNFLNRWHVGFDRMLLGALDIAPFYDNVWSAPLMPESTWGDAPENYTELAMALSVLGGGAVGIGDYIGASNVSLIMSTAMADGKLLSPSRPSTYIDAVYLPTGSQPWPVARGRVFQAPSFLPLASNGSSAGLTTWTTILSVDVTSPFLLLPGFLYPSLAVAEHGTSGTYAAVPWVRGGASAISAACADGQPASGCAATFDALNPLDLYTGAPTETYAHFFELWSLAPVLNSGWSLIGELSKFVRVSPRRFSWVNVTNDGMAFEVTGAPNEAVGVHVIAPGGVSTIRVVSVSFGPAGGVAVVSCAGYGSGAGCSETASPVNY